MYSFCYIKKKIKMAKILKCVFVYAIILIFFLLLIAEKVHGGQLFLYLFKLSCILYIIYTLFDLILTIFFLLFDYSKSKM